MRVRWAVLVLAALAATSLVGDAVRPARTPGGSVELVVTLRQPPLARVPRTDARLKLDSPASRAYLARLGREQDAVAARIGKAIPGASVRWRYTTTLNGLAVVVPRRAESRLAAVDGVARVWQNVRYGTARTALASARTARAAGPAVDTIGASAIWGPNLETAGNGMKIAIIDDGVDQSHPFFNPAGFTMPPGFPKGNRAFTTAKVIVAKAFPPPSPKYVDAAKPFDAKNSFHATHVAGIAAGDHAVSAIVSGSRLTISGVAPNAYIGNYKALTIPTPDFALDGNAPELAKAIEEAVKDGMDVINMSLGEPEVEPSRDLVVQALDGAAAAGVIPTVAAGNDFDQFGYGSIGSPGSSASAITAGASTGSNTMAFFSSAAPTPLSLRLKPDVTAPGSSIVSSVPGANPWGELSGTSMASPHLAGAAALLRQRHPTWTVAQVKSALVQTAALLAAPVMRQGGGLIDLRQADAPLLFAFPVSLSFGELHPGATAVSQTVELTDAGGGAGAWTASVTVHDGDGSQVSVPAVVTVPGSLQVTAAVPPGLSEGDHAGYVVLRKDTVTRRIPYWFTVSTPRLAAEPHLTLRRPGTYAGTTRGKPSLVSLYRYPSDPTGAGVATRLNGPEAVYRITVPRRAANAGVVVLSGRAEPRIVLAGNEARLAGYSALPLYLNPYTSRYGEPIPAAAVDLPLQGAYDVVFDTRAADHAGPFTFRYWIDDRTPPALQLLTRRVARRGSVVVRATDAGAGIDPASIAVSVDGRVRTARYSRARGRLTFPAGSLRPGRHALVVIAADFQEAKNNENEARILPNTRTLRTTIVVAG